MKEEKKENNSQEEINELNNLNETSSQEESSESSASDEQLLVSSEQETEKISGEKKSAEKWYKKFKMPSSMAIIFGIIIFVMILTWVIPHDSYAEAVGTDGELIHVNALGQYNDLGWYANGVFGLGFLGNGWFVSSSGRYGILDLPMLLFTGFLDAAGVILFVFAIGMFLEIMMASKTLEAGVKSLERKMEGKELLLIPVLFVLFSLGGSTYGMQEETIGFFPIIVPFLILAGFDSMTGFLVIVMGTTTGIAASTVNPFSIGVFSSGVPDYVSEGNPDVVISSGTGIVTRLVVWMIFTAIGASLLTYYSYRVKNNPDKSLLKDRREEDIVWARNKMGIIDNDEKDISKMTRKQSIAMILFTLTFVLMIFGMLPWSEWNVDMDWFLSWIFFGNVLLGGWYYIQLIALFVMSGILIGLVFGMSTKQISSSMWKGAKSMTGVAIIIGVARTIAIILVYSGVNDAIIKTMLDSGIGNAGGVLFVTIMFPIFLVLSMLIPSTSGLASAVAPTIGGTVAGIATTPDEYIAIIAGTMLAYSLAEGIVNMFIPSNAIIFAQADSANLEYGQVLKPLVSYAALITILSFIILPLTMVITL